VRAAQEAAQRERLAAPSAAALEQFFAALLASGRAVQSAVLAAPAPADPAARPHDLDTALRPALTRVTERIAALLPRLPIRLAESALAEELAARSGDLPGFDEAERARLASALAALASAPRGR
jgi:cyclohexadienyl dehydratase